MLAIGLRDSLRRRLQNLDDLSDLQTLRKNLRVRQRWLVLEMRDPSELIGRPCRDRRIARGCDASIAAGDRITVRIEPRMPQRCRERIHLIRCERVLASFRRGMDVAKRKARFVCEVPFEQTMGTDDLSRDAFALGGELELLAARCDQLLLLHPIQQLHQPPVTQPQRAAEGRE